MKTRYHKTLFIASGLGLVLLLMLVYSPSTVQAWDRQVNPYGYHHPRVSDPHWGYHRYGSPPVRYRHVEVDRFRPHYRHDWSYYHRPYHYRPIPSPHAYRGGYHHGRYPRTS